MPGSPPPMIVVREVRHEDDPVKGSRFIATLAPVRSREEAEALLERIRADHPGASHHGWAFRLGPRGDEYRFSDDGEPGGSAGRPIMQRLEGRGVTDAMLVVSRIFGGTKLGVGGLVRAYGGAAGRALDRAELRPLVATRRLRVRVAYADAGTVERALEAAGLAPAADYGADVLFDVEVAERDVDSIAGRLRDATAGRATMEVAGDRPPKQS